MGHHHTLVWDIITPSYEMSSHARVEHHHTLVAMALKSRQYILL